MSKKIDGVTVRIERSGLAQAWPSTEASLSYGGIMDDWYATLITR